MRAKRGLTLVEVLVALVLVAVAVSMFVYFIDALRLTRISSNEAEISAYMRNYLDTLRSAWRDTDNYFDLSSEIAGRNIVQPPEAPQGSRVNVTITSDEGTVYSGSGRGSGTDYSNLRDVQIEVTANETVYSLHTQISRPLLREPSATEESP